YHWELTLGALYQLGADLDFEGGSTVATRDDFGLSIGGAYNITDQLATSFGLQWTGISYNANVVQDDGRVTGIRGSYDTWATSVNALYHFTDDALAPYAGVGIGWTWVDTNIPTGLPSTGCWWDPWFGWICVTSYPTKTTDTFSYQAILGLRYQLNFDTFLRFSYTSQWQDFGQAEGTPRFDVIGLEFGWMF
ncbi:MAG TPA: outer membrane beta-barrel protein, partial [Candidatus Sulfomarinibacteraceae bacterium]|nr:outer membrane beta-barrel protein [Candidatus Sulfomarinibacteraceae bacterium]